VAGITTALYAVTARVVFGHLAEEEADGHVVNVAGRQRMLAQRMAREALTFAAGDEQALARLEEAASEFRTSLASLLHGDADRGLPAAASEARMHLGTIERDWASMARAIALLGASGSDQRTVDEHASAVVGRADDLTTSSDRAVAAFDLAFATRVRRLRGRMTLLGLGGAAVLGATYVTLLADATRRTARAEAEVARKEAALQELAAERQELVRRLLSASEDERRRVAGDIHDGPTQQLIGAAMLLEAIAQDAQDIGGPPPQLATAQAYLESAVEETRRIIRDLRPPLLDDVGVAEALARSLTPIARDFDVELRIDATRLLVRPSARTEVALYRVAHEAATNAIRHSGASAVEIKLATSASSDAVELRVRDEGSGFEPARVLAETGRRPFGLLGMRERVELLGGDFQLETHPGSGTTIRASIPAAGGA